MFTFLNPTIRIGIWSKQKFNLPKDFVSVRKSRIIRYINNKFKIAIDSRYLMKKVFSFKGSETT